MSSAPAAAFDVGTNTVLLLIGRLASPGAPGAGALEIVEDHCRTPRLGQGVASKGALDAQAVERTLAALRELHARVVAHGIPRERVRAVGTAVFRRARDSNDFVERVRRELGLSIEVASEEEEAELSYRAVVGAHGDRRTLVIDVGGGSTELGSDGGRVRFSAPVGALVLCETFGAAQRTPPERVEAIVRAAREACARFPEGGAARAGAEVVGLGGSALNLAALELGLPRFDHVATEGARVSADAAMRQARRLFALDAAERQALPIEATRAEILPCGLVCLAAALERIGARDLRLSGRGLRFGVLEELLSRSGAGNECGRAATTPGAAGSRDSG